MKRLASFGQVILLAYLSLLFNGEIYAHGLPGLILVPLIIFYFVYIGLIFFLKNKYKLSTRATFALGAAIGLLLEIFYSKSIFYAPVIFGFNPFSVMIQIVYWGFSAIIPFYIIKNVFKNNREEKDKNIIKLNLFISIYLLFEFSLGSIRFSPTWTWIISGTILGLLILPILLKKNSAISI